MYVHSTSLSPLLLPPQLLGLLLLLSICSTLLDSVSDCQQSLRLLFLGQGRLGDGVGLLHHVWLVNIRVILMLAEPRQRTY